MSAAVGMFVVSVTPALSRSAPALALKSALAGDVTFANWLA
jgi:hypothetical protein